MPSNDEILTITIDGVALEGFKGYLYDPEVCGFNLTLGTSIYDYESENAEINITLPNRYRGQVKVWDGQKVSLKFKSHYQEREIEAQFSVDDDDVSSSDTIQVSLLFPRFCLNYF